MTNSTLPAHSSRIRVCMYENCNNKFVKRSNNHKVSQYEIIYIYVYNLISLSILFLFFILFKI